MGILSTPVTIRGMTVENRIMRSATMEYMADLDGHVTDDLLRLYYDLARGGAGLIVTGCSAVQENGKAWAHQLGIWDDTCITGFAKLARVIRRHGPGCRSAVQISHQGTAGYGYSYGALDKGYSLENVSGSDIRGTIEAFRDAAGRVKDAGFDAVAVHGAHGYLLSEFLSPATNNRTDEWGGSLENRLRLSLEVCHAIRERVGEEFPILWKLNTSDYVPGGANVEEYAEAASQLVQNGVDLIELSGGIKDQMKLRAKLRQEAGSKEAYFREAIPRFRTAIKHAPLAITGGIRSMEVMEALLEQGVDLIGMCRPLISEPDLPKRLLHGPDKRPARCTSCSKCLRRIARQAVKALERRNSGLGSDSSRQDLH
ncbi:MAG: NADH:flavin oxidoreductase [Deltaproteobacteria bacterium]